MNKMFALFAVLLLALSPFAVRQTEAQEFCGNPKPLVSCVTFQCVNGDWKPEHIRVGAKCTVADQGGTCGGSGLCVPTPPTNKAYTRQDVVNLTAKQIASLKRGFRVMMEYCKKTPILSTNESDPICLTYQANIHATDPGENGGCHMGDPGNPLWDQCQHASYFFLAWHRMYLYYFEKILRAASGDPNLALPYWNYESSSEQTLPSAFLTPALDCNGDPNSHPGCNPLFLTGRTLNGGQALPSGAADDSQAMMDTTFEASLGANFGGGPPSSPPAPCHFNGNTGDLESQPHNVIHCDVGGQMCDPGTAARDPIFWLHHAEIDHLWKVWLAQGGGRANPTDTTWSDTTFRFYDIDTGTIVSKSAKDVLDTAVQLNYRYDDDPTPSPPSAPAPRIELRPQFPSTPPEELSVSPETGIELSSETVRAQINIPLEAQAKITHLLEDKEFKHAIVLSLEIDHVKDSSGVHYEIYANLPANEKPARDSIYYVANLGLFFPRKRMPVSS